MSDNARRRVEEYKDHIIITDGKVYQAFWSAKRYINLSTIRAAIDNGTIDNGVSYNDNRVLTLDNMV